jgi:hypothetical protein
MSVAGRTRRAPTVTSYHVRLSDGQEFTVIADAAQKVCSREEHRRRGASTDIANPRRRCGTA